MLVSQQEGAGLATAAEGSVDPQQRLLRRVVGDIAVATYGGVVEPAMELMVALLTPCVTFGAGAGGI